MAAVSSWHRPRDHSGAGVRMGVSLIAMKSVIPGTSKEIIILERNFKKNSDNQNFDSLLVSHLILTF